MASVNERGRGLLRFLGGAPAWLGVLLIRAYQKSAGRLLGGRCRFHPSCSEYAAGSIQAHGLALGAIHAGWRLLRCGPWTAGGVDPVRVRRGAEAARG